MNIEANINEFVFGNGIGPSILPFDRYASFDYCFNYFQSFREQNAINQIIIPQYIENSCLQLGFYLASWGMLRGSTFLLQKSVRVYEPIINLIADCDPELWNIDTHNYSDDNIERLLQFGKSISKIFENASDILITKIMLGVFGNVPAFDTYFKKGFSVGYYGKSALKRIGAFYQDHNEIIDISRRPTIEFTTGKSTNRLYTRAKIIDMIFFIEGAKLSKQAQQTASADLAKAQRENA